MANEEALKQLQLFAGTMECPSLEAIETAIEALESNNKLAEDLQNCLDMYKKKKAEVEALKQNKCDGCFYLDRNGATCEFCARNYPDRFSTRAEEEKE